MSSIGLRRLLAMADGHDRISGVTITEREKGSGSKAVSLSLRRVCKSPPIASAEAGQDLIADRAAPRGEFVESGGCAEELSSGSHNGSSQQGWTQAGDGRPAIPRLKLSISKTKA